MGTGREVDVPRSPNMSTSPPAKRAKKAQKVSVSGIQTKVSAPPRRNLKSAKVQSTPRTPKTYGARTKKAALAKPASVDYDEIPGPDAVVALKTESSSDPIAIDSSIQRSEPVTRSKVAGMNGKSGKPVTPVKPSARVGKGKKAAALPKADIASPVVAKEPPRSVTPLPKSSTTTEPVLIGVKEDVASKPTSQLTAQTVAGEKQKTTKVESILTVFDLH